MSNRRRAMILRIVEADVCGAPLPRLFVQRRRAEDGRCQSVVVGPVFEPLRDPAHFAEARLDPVCGTVRSVKVARARSTLPFGAIAGNLGPGLRPKRVRFLLFQPEYS